MESKGNKDSDGNLFVTVIMPTPVLSATQLGAEPLTFKLDVELPHFNNLKVQHTTWDVFNPVIKVCDDTGVGVSSMCLSYLVSLFLTYCMLHIK